MMCHYADIYNANRLKEYCAWYHRVHPSVDMMLEGEEISQFSFLDKQSKSVSQSQPNATLGDNEASCVLTDSILHL